MKSHHLLVTTAALVLLASPAFAQVDPHHPEEALPPVTTEGTTPMEGAVEEPTNPPASAPAPAVPSPAAPPAMPMMQMMGQKQMMQMMRMQQMHETEMMHMQQMHQMETMHAMQMRGIQMHGMMSGMGAMSGMNMSGMEMMPGMEMLKRPEHGTPPSDGCVAAPPAAPAAAEPAPMGDGMAAPASNDPDVAFVQSIIPHHEGAIAMAEEVLRTGKDEEVRSWAKEILDVQQTKIAEMRAWLDRHPQ